MLFNHRRQSRDRAVIADVVASLDGADLRIAPYSATLFANSDVEPLASEDFLSVAKAGDVCFVEDRSLSEYVDSIEELTVYGWNRHYPSDFYFDLDLSANGFSLVQTLEFAGYSHEKITKEIYRK